jgi:5'-3' exonuclease
VKGTHVVQLDRRTGVLRDRAGVVEKFGVEPESIPDYLALVGDSADGFPGLPGWGPRSASQILGRYRHLEAIPVEARTWDVPVRGAARLAATFREQREDALLFRKLATLRIDRSVLAGGVDAVAWRGPAPGFAALCERLRLPGLAERARRRAEPGAGSR